MLDVELDRVVVTGVVVGDVWGVCFSGVWAEVEEGVSV